MVRRKSVDIDLDTAHRLKSQGDDCLLRQIFCTCDMSANRLRGYVIKLIVIPGPPLMLCEIFAAPAIP